MEFEVTIPNLPELRRAFREHPKIAEPIYQKAIVGTQFIFQKNTLKDDPVPWKTGNLLQSFRFTARRLEGRWFPTANYAAFVELGTKPHEIRPKSASVLAWPHGGTSGGYVTSAGGRQYFKSGSGGSTRFATHVNHPGTKAQPFMQKIVDKSLPEVGKLFLQAADIVNREIAKRVNLR